jgi:uncharacterized protein with LGFP repeats/glucose/arabinose dehydrogenase
MRMRRTVTAAAVGATLVGLMVALPAPVVSAAPNLPAGFLLQDLPTGLRAPSPNGDPGDLITDFAFLPDENMLVTGKYGKVMWVPKTGTPRQIANLSVLGVQDLGLTSIAVAPDYATSRVVYTARTVPGNHPGTGAFGELRLSEWTVTVDGAGNPTGLTGERTVLTMTSDANVHAMTTVLAAEDGTLWVAIGDSADYVNVDPLALRAIDRDDPHGKVMHINPDGSGVPSNPYYQPASPGSVRSKIYASGFRSPFRMSLDPVSGRPILGDVGWNTFEEINLLEPGNDYGWPCWEALEPTPGYRDLPGCAGKTSVAPLWSYPRSMGSSAVGGVVYTGTSYPQEYQGRYFFGDYSSNRIWTMTFDRDGDRTTDPEDPGFGTAMGAPVKFATMPTGGDIVYADIGSGKIRRLVYAQGNSPPTASITTQSDPATRTVTFDAGDSFDPNGDALSYRWEFGDGGTATGTRVTHTYPASPDSFTATLTATDTLNASGSDTVTVFPSNYSPELTLRAPGPDQLFSVGDVITADATATDREDGGLAISWTTDVRHCRGITNCHSHPGERQEGPQFRMTFEGHPGDTHLEITAIATDSRGAVTARTFVAHPRQRRVTVQSSTPAAFTIGDEQISSSLFTVGQQLSVIAPETAGDGVATFDRWADGAPRVRTITVPDNDVTLDVGYLTPIDRRYAQDVTLRATIGTPMQVEQGDATVRWREYTKGYVYWSPEAGVHEVHGAILNSYLAAGSHLKFGVPTTDELSTPDGRGRYALFTGGRAIYWTEQTLAHTVLGAIYPKWTSLGGQTGFLGYPATDQLPTPDGVGLFNHFQGGSIYTHPGVGTFEVHGSIKTLWSQVGWELSPLGYPRTDETTSSDGVARFNHFQGGSIYAHPTVGVHEVHGEIWKRWSGLGLERSALGYPTTNETIPPDRVGRFNHFQAGSVYWHPNTGAYEVRGSIRALWAQLGWERSFLGYPVTNETGTPDGIGRFNHFQGQNGSIYWSPNTGAHELRGAIKARWAALGWEGSYLGYPTSNEYDVAGGRRSDFQNGYIVWNRATGAVTDRRY